MSEKSQLQRRISRLNITATTAVVIKTAKKHEKKLVVCSKF